MVKISKRHAVFLRIGNLNDGVLYKTPINHHNMQKRHSNRKLYFKELSVTSEKYFIPYIQTKLSITPGTHVLEIGCGEGGNLLPFSKRGCEVTGVDLNKERIKDAITYFQEEQVKGEFIAADIFKLENIKERFDLILCHDVLEHIDKKQEFLYLLTKYLKPKGIVFMAFPAWYMPFGGHQQICKNRILSHLPFIHLLPYCVYSGLLKLGGESTNSIEELIHIKATGLSIEKFERLLQATEWFVLHRQLYFINPHYEIKFGMQPCKLSKPLSTIPFLRNLLTTSCFYLLTK